MERVEKPNDEWKNELPPEVYQVTREKGTERPFTGKYWNAKEKGIYCCSSCGLELFSSGTKFDSGTGWPSFTEPANVENVELVPDESGGPPSPEGFGRPSMSRVEVLCKRYGAHLGHVFDDPPRIAGKAGGSKNRGGKRYCINSCSLELKKDVNAKA